MARYFLLSLVFALISTVTFAQQASLSGKITDGDNGEELIAANVTLYKGGVLITGVTTDFEGNYSINLDPGTYDVETSYVGYSSTRTNGVIVRAGQTNKLDVALGTGINIEEIVVIDYRVPLIEVDNTTQGKIVTSEDIRKFASKNINSVAASTAGMSQVDEGDGLTSRGSRSDATDVYVDGMRVRASSVQEADVEQLQVITGGIPAFYGDVTGGIISITTKGPSAKFSGGVEVETSEFLDDYGYNQVRANVSGPILKKKDTGESIIGFRFSGAYTSRLDDDPTAIGVYVVNDEKKRELEATPAIGIKPTAEFLTNDDVEVLNYRPDEESSNLNITGKIDARLSKNIDISLTGAYVDDKDKFTPGGGRDTWRLLNSHNNPTDYTKRYRGNFRFRHKLGGNNAVDAGGEKKSSLIQNAQYTLQFGYEKEQGTDYDPRHKDNFFDYGHYGTYNFEGGPEFDFTPIIDVSSPPEIILVDSFTHTSYETTNNTSFSSEGSKNPVLANYNGAADQTGSGLPLIANGIMNEQLEDVWAGLHTNIGQVYNRYNVNESEIITANANFSFDLLPGGSEEGRHSIQVGLLFEQRFSRNYTLNPERLWEIGQQSVNSHILGLNTDDILRYEGVTGIFDTDSIREYAVYNTLLSEEEDLVGSRFYREVRNNTGIESINADLSGLHAYVNINSLDPSQLSLDMFAPKEIADFSGITEYYGYDYLGNKLDNSITFEDFFTAKDPDGARSFLVPSFQPNYFAFFLEDKFSFKDIIFRIGLRVDRYDANTKVLKDPYSLYEVATVADIPDLQAPGNIGSDYNVYVESQGSPTVKGYRDGDQWYTPEGTAVNDGTLIFGGGAVVPRLKSPDEANIKVDNYRISNSFEDYKPQINVMPRLAFSFPISDAANFFAHYDILVQRPPSNSIVSPLQYYYFYDRTPPENNGNLKPERTIDYEVGFQQKLSNSSAIKIAAYYKEMRDMIQLRNFTQVASVATEYLAFDNLDFGTVKGFSFQYDLRRTGNISANINYTLQFADGTGSDPESARDLAQRGRIRNIYPLNFDERHRIVGQVDYRYDSGKGYNGPRWFGKDVFASAGVNMQAIAVSGRPYTAKIQEQSFGGDGTLGAINGARQPWTFTVNMRADKNFTLSKPGAKRPLSLNVYIRIQNLLDARNIVNVYSASGSPSDDGFLISQLGQDQLNEFSPDERGLYEQSYSWTVQNPNNFTQPRRIFMGAIFDF
ncbi:MAG: outer membrane receptor protein involved in Fe transport [Patescibacteria group bacterium]|jgi:outer membrane receptor protein involved in Fe transport